MEHLDRQTGVVSSKDDIIQSVTEKSQVAHVRLKYAEDKITHLNAKLQSERDRRHRKTKELLDEQARAQDRHESEIRRLKQEAQDAQEQLDSLRSKMSELHADGRSPLDHDHSALYRDHWVALEKLFTWMRQGECDTSQPPLPPEHIYDTDGPPISPAANVDSESSPLSTKRDHWVALEELFGWMRQEEYESAQDAVKPNEEQESQSRLQDELAATKEQLCLVEEEYLSVRCDIDQSREALREVKSHVVSLQFEWEMCKALVREAQEARRSSLTELAEVIELLRVSQAEWEESQFRCSQVTFLCGALQERVTELEAETKKGLKKCPAITPGHTNSEYRSCCPRYGTAPSDVEAITHEHELNLQESDSIDMIVPPLQPWIFDFSLPASPSPSSLYLNPQRSAISPTPSDIHSHSFCLSDTDIHSIIYNSDSFLIELSLAVRSCDSNSSHHYEVGLGNEQDVQQSTELGRSAVDPDFTYLGHLPPPSSPSSAGVSRLLSPIYRTFLSERNSLGSMDWPPIGSALSPGSGNVRQDREEDVGFEDGTDDPILSYQESLSPFQEPDPMDRRDPKPQISSIITPSSPPIQNFSHREVIYPLRQDRYSVTKTSPTSSSNRQDVPIRPPHHSLPPLRNLPPPPLLELQDSVSIDSVSDGSVQLRKGRRRASHRRGFSHLHGIPVPKLDYDLPADFVPPSFRRIAPTRQMDDFAFLIPLDCHTSTPAAARRRTRTGQTHS
ncbi:hypothetical protein BGY98DRAFT_611740 [Russula aff. rugulosa BPL654]|nr:hypothetical protein BGY98DRAFT_611740 [Russula aff. rugulosa BPL654]